MKVKVLKAFERDEKQYLPGMANVPEHQVAQLASEGLIIAPTGWVPPGQVAAAAVSAPDGGTQAGGAEDPLEPIAAQISAAMGVPRGSEAPLKFLQGFAGQCVVSAQRLEDEADQRVDELRTELDKVTTERNEAQQTADALRAENETLRLPASAPKAGDGKAEPAKASEAKVEAVDDAKSGKAKGTEAKT